MSSQPVPVSRLAKLTNPYDNPWQGDEFTTEDVKKAIEEKRFCAEPYLEQTCFRWPTSKHIERIAYLAVHGWTDPLHVDVGIPSLGFMPACPVTDGNHRLAAAMYAKKRYVDCSISGEVRAIKMLLGVDVSDTETVEA